MIRIVAAVLLLILSALAGLISLAVIGRIVMWISPKPPGLDSMAYMKEMCVSFCASLVVTVIVAVLLFRCRCGP